MGDPPYIHLLAGMTKNNDPLELDHWNCDVIGESAVRPGTSLDLMEPIERATGSYWCLLEPAGAGWSRTRAVSAATRCPGEDEMRHNM